MAVVSMNANSLRRFHRGHALIMSAIVAASAASGLIHTWMGMTQGPPPRAAPASAVDTAAVRLSPAEAVTLATALRPPGAGSLTVTGLDLRPIGGVPFWRILGGPAPIWVDATQPVVDADADVRYALQVARAAVGDGAKLRHDGVLTAYDQEYIAIFRLLPVHRIRVDDGKGTRLYVSTVTGSVARQTDDWKQFEANVFTYAHKWAFLPRPWRDYALIIAMAGILVLAVSGVVLAVLTRRRKA
jgi:hypothetical protein